MGGHYPGKIKINYKKCACISALIREKTKCARNYFGSMNVSTLPFPRINKIIQINFISFDTFLFLQFYFA